MWHVVAAIGATCATGAAPAATLVQFDSEQGASAGFAGFDAALGTLDKVTLDIAIAKSRVWQISVASSTPVTANVSWVVDGDWLLGPGNVPAAGTLVPLTGTGSTVVTLDRFFDGRAFGFFQVDATGSTTLELDPARFVGRANRFNGFDLGHNGDVGDTSFPVVPAGSQRFQLEGSCVVTNGNPSQPIGEDFCGSANYTLTYHYTPAGAVPEPATWGLMLAGFAVTGAALRRRRRAATA